MKIQSAILCLFLTISCLVYGQRDSVNMFPDSEKKNYIDLDDIEKLKNIVKRIKIGGVFQMQYVNSLSSGINYKGVHFGETPHTSNSFDVKRMRVSVQVEIMPKMKIVTLVNLADYKTDPKNKVLENAYLAYDLNKYLNFRVGQFRPKFNPENMYPVDVVKSLEYSNIYHEFGANGWGGFQVGLDVSGKVDLGKIPMSYNLAVFNGNGKNKTDSDNGKQFLGRTAFIFSKKYGINLGLSGGWGKVSNKDVYMASVDASALFPFTPQWSLSLEAQASQGTNHDTYFKTDMDKRIGNLSDYIMRGWFALPNLRYQLGNKYLHALELSCRYEQLETNKLEHNLRQTLVPAFTMEFLKNYNLRLTIAMQMNRYKHSIPNTSKYNSHILTTQLQVRF